MDRHCIRLITLQDLYDSKDTDELIFNLMNSVNQHMSDQTSEAAKRGIRQSARKGNFTGSIVPYGYEIVILNGRKTLRIEDELMADVVKSIFEWYVHHHMGNVIRFEVLTV